MRGKSLKNINSGEIFKYFLLKMRDPLAQETFVQALTGPAEPRGGVHHGLEEL
jgi:hypothetical protein